MLKFDRKCKTCINYHLLHNSCSLEESNIICHKHDKYKLNNGLSFWERFLIKYFT